MGNSVVGLAGDQVLAIAQADAARVYRDLSLYRIQLVLEDDGWHVDYELKNPRLKGERGDALRLLLNIFERGEAIRLLRAG